MAKLTDVTPAVLTFGLLLACAASVMGAIGWQAFIGFVLGVTTTFAAAVIAWH